MKAINVASVKVILKQQSICFFHVLMLSRITFQVILETIHGMVSDKISTVPLIGHKIITYSISLKYIKTDLMINVLLILAFLIRDS